MKIKLIILFIFVSGMLHAQNHTISGIVSDKETGEKLIGAYLYIKEFKTGTLTNAYGFYSITVPDNSSVTIRCSYIGYKTSNIYFNLKKDRTYNFLMIQNNELQEVIIRGESNKSLQTPTSSMNSISVKQLKNLPSITGENDVLLAFQKMPGVQGGNEGTGALFVRGGSADQNLYLIDNVPIYYVNHLGGFISVFDENAINSVKLYKGGFPAQYNGKLSSIFDIRLKDGNKKKIHGEIKLDILASKIFVEGPMLKKKATFMVSIRRCNLDLITRTLFREKGNNGAGAYGYSFLDFNTKVNFPLSEKDALSVFAYYGKDKMFEKFNGTNDPFDSPVTNKDLWDTKWGNKLAGFKWNRIISNKLFANSTIAYTSFNYKNSSETEEYSTDTGKLIYENKTETASGIVDLIAKFALNFYPATKHQFKIGISAVNHTFSPNSAHYFQTGNHKLDTVFGDLKINAREYNAFLSYKGQIGKRFSFNAGVNFSNYVTDSLNFLNYQPRLITNYIITKNVSFKLSYSKMTQFAHLLSSSNIGMPTDMWLPATTLAKPENSDIYSTAFVWFYKNLEITSEYYYKTMNNLIDFKEASNFNQNASWTEKIETNGVGLSSGFEFLIQKTSGKFNGWLAYTWSKNFRQFENINSGNRFPFKFDRRHDFSLILTYKLSKKMTFSATWVFSSGYPITIGIGRYSVKEMNNGSNVSQTENYNELFKIINQDVLFYGGRNNYRMPAYHRLDIGASFTKQKKYGKRQIKVGIYNVYNHLNPYFLYYQYDYKEQKLKLYQYILFPIIPSVSYSFLF